ncbi:MAG: metallophosphoesterase family protein [Desulfosporosinus fructosivorans]
MAPCVRFLQCAGCRFDSPFWEGPEGWAAQRNQDLWQTFEAVLSLCRSEKVEILFLTGDIFEQEYVHKATVERVARSLATLKGTRIFIAPGERDPLVATSAYRLAVWPSNVHIFSSGISSVKIPSLNVTVYGAGWTAYQQEDPFFDSFQVVQDGTIPIMLLHAEMASVKNSVGFIPIFPENIIASGLAYLALGHQERWTGIQKAGETVWSDSGFLEARSFAENGPHGVVMGELEQESVQVKFLELGQRHYIEKTLEIQDHQANIVAISSKLLSETSPEERQKDLYRVNLSGPFREVEAVVQPLQKLLADEFRFLEIVHTEGQTNARFGTDVVTPFETITENGEGYLTVSQVFINKLKERQFLAVDTENQEHCELVMKIGLAALGQGRIDNEN